MWTYINWTPQHKDVSLSTMHIYCNKDIHDHNSSTYSQASRFLQRPIFRNHFFCLFYMQINWVPSLLVIPRHTVLPKSKKRIHVDKQPTFWSLTSQKQHKAWISKYICIYKKIITGITLKSRLVARKLKKRTGK